MTTETPILTDAEANEVRQQLYRYENQKAYEAALKRHDAYLAVEPIVSSPEFETLRAMVLALRETGPKDDGYFGIGIEAVHNGMTNLGIQVANWKPPVDPNATVEAPAPTPDADPSADPAAE